MMDIIGISNIISEVGKVADDLFTSDEERGKVEIEAMKIDASRMSGQMEVNKTEAQHKSIFVAGWRPAIGWIGAIALAYQFLLYPMLMWVWVLLKSKNIIPIELNPPPVFESGPLFAIITGMLGIGGMRSFDKIRGKQTDKL